MAVDNDDIDDNDSDNENGDNERKRYLTSGLGGKRNDAVDWELGVGRRGMRVLNCLILAIPKD